MLELSDTVTRKFIESFDVSDWEIETDSGWQDVSAIHKTVEYEEWIIRTENGKELICADDHIVFDENMNEIFVKHCIPNVTYIQTKNGIELVTELYNTDTFSNMYDITVDSPDHRFYSGDILSHNSTVVCAFVLWYMLFNGKQPTVAFLANKGKTAMEILRKVQLAYSNLPLWLQPGVTDWNKTSFELENGARAVSEATSPDSIRGYAVDLLFVDEAAFVDNWDEFWPSTYNTITSSDTTSAVLVSTPRGLNHFHKLWHDAHKQSNPDPEVADEWNEFHPIKVTWRDVPGRDEKWKKLALAAVGGDQGAFDQEHNVEFLGSTNTLLSGACLQYLREKCIKKPLFEREGLKQYVKPIQGHQYILIADVSEGKGLDYSAFSVIDVTAKPFEQVCVYRSNELTPLDYAEVIHAVGNFYNKASILVELNSIGGQVLHILHHEKEYENLIRTEPTRVGQSKKVSGGFSNKPHELGVRTTKTVKATGCSLAKILIEQNELKIWDETTIYELSRFSKKSQTIGYQAEKGATDDIVMGLVLFGWLSDQNYFLELTDVDVLARLRNMDERRTVENLVPFATIYTHQPQAAESSYFGPDNPEGWKADEDYEPMVRIIF